MASGTEDTESRFLERLFNSRRDLSLFIPFMLGLNGTAEATENHDSTDGGDDGGRPSRIIVINPFTQGMIVIEGASGLDSQPVKEGRPPASKASIEALPAVEIGGDAASADWDCAICLEEWSPGGSAKEMPCRHRFHADCIEKWLGIHGSCPVCRYEMPMEDGDSGEKRGGQGGGGEEDGRRRVRREVWVSFGFGGRRPNQDSTDPSPGSEVE